MKAACALVGATALIVTGIASADISDGEIRVGLMTDLSSVYSDVAGQGAVIAAEMAIEDAGGEIDGNRIVLIAADHGSDGETAERIAQDLIRDRNVDVFAELVSSSTALPVQEIAREHGKVVLHSGAASSSLTGENCSPTGIHWAYDTYALATGTARAVVQQGGHSWFFITADYSFGHNLQQDTAAVVEEAGGEVAGSALHPFKGRDFTASLLEARTSGADVVALANAGDDTLNTIRQAYELGIIQGGQSLASLLMFITDVRRLGLYVAGGLKLTTGFYWGLNEETRAWSARFKRRSGTMPTMVQASVYSSLRHYFNAIEAIGSDDGPAVAQRMRETPVNDFFARNGRIREDGRMVHDMYLVEVKSPSESEQAWDYFELLQTIPGEQAFRPLEEGGCPLVE